MRILKGKDTDLQGTRNVNSIPLSLASQAYIRLVYEDIDGAMSLYKEEERIWRERGIMNSLALALVNQALILNGQNNPQEALPLAEEAYMITVEHGYTTLSEIIQSHFEKIQQEANKRK